MGRHSDVAARVARFLGIAVCWLALCGAAAASGDASVMEVRYWVWNEASKSEDYLAAALRLALDKTRARYGDYAISARSFPGSTARLRGEVFRGELINVLVGPWRAFDSIPANLRIDVGLYGGMQGCKSLFVRAGELEKFAQIKDVQALRQVRAGQARDWADVGIYQENQVPVEDSGNYQSLFSMLLGQRFDYIAISMLEVEAVAQDQRVDRRRVAVTPDLMLFYPFPMVFYVSPKEPVLAQRLGEGLRQARVDGSLDKLTQAHFHAEISRYRAQNPRVIKLKNSALPAELAAEVPVCAQGR